jgi:hypothetical protein
MARPKYKLMPGAIAMIRRDYLVGKTVKALADEYQVTTMSIYRALGDLPGQRRTAHLQPKGNDNAPH